MKYIIIILSLFINACSDDSSSGGGSSSCNSCQSGALETHFDTFEGDVCSTEELNQLNCINSVSINSTTCDILYFVDTAIAGFQFDISGTGMNGVIIGPDTELFGTDFSLSMSPNEVDENTYRFLGFSGTGQNIPAGCGILFSIDAANCSNFEFEEVIFSDPNADEFEVCPN